MRCSTLILSVFVFLLGFAGCSSSSNNPAQPESPLLPQAGVSHDGAALLYQGTFEIDLETQTITQHENREASTIYDITGFLPDKCPGGCFRFSIVGVVGTVLEIELTLENPITIQVYDARVQYLDLFGKTVLNPDSYTDFLGTPITKIYPFTAYAKDVPDRAFPVGPGGIDTETMFLDFPPGAPSAVNYAITAHLPGNTPEPYEVSEMSQSGTLTPTGGSAIIRCKVDDHQDNISGVYMNAIPFAGAPVQLVFNDPMWEVEFSNTAGAPVGIYNQLIMALSPNGQNVSTYNYVEITVSEDIVRGIWPTTQGDIANTGCIGLNGPAGELGSPDWSNDVCRWNALQIFLNEDMAFASSVGTGSENGYASGVRLSDGQTIWTKAYSTSANTYLAVKGLSADGSIVFCCQSSNGTMYGLDAATGDEIWSTPGSIMCDSYLTLDLEGNFIVPSSDGIRSMNPQTGAINWTAPIGNAYYCTPAVGADGTIYAYSYFTNCPLHAFNPATGADNWTEFPNIGECHNGITVHPTLGYIVIHTRISGGTLLCFEDNGASSTEVWRQSYGYPWYCSTAVGANGDIYLLDYSGTLRRINPIDGVTIDSTSGWGDGYGARPAIGEDGLIYIGDRRNFRVFNPDCTQVSSHYDGAGYFKGPAIGNDGWVYALSTSGIHAWHD
ncbi:PQQ-like beta-propeller repeat protein [bacterium]|nr:PQQ-like beta-propeller repeat protein [bacterium]